ncbi:hypothetical protein [uncultured Mucilaginibacter sp.]|uniref:hypothetical protein n=1 Tax=uncultured Mucilaginibacter sp. TaxID=797541 RepID=UPI0025E5C800|nr:hypothetical protein [uncultured Mucilaginibacter sp.]
MELKVDIGFEELLHAIQQLPEDQLTALKDKLNGDKNPSGMADLKNNANDPKNSSNMDELRALLLTGPVFTKEQLKAISDARKQINKWRTK